MESQTPQSKPPLCTPTSHSALKAELVYELRKSAFQSDSLLDTVCPLSDELDPAIDELACSFLAPSPSLPSGGSRGQSSPHNTSHPLAGTRSELNTSDQRPNYSPIVKIFNAILALARDQDGFHSHLEFIVYNTSDGEEASKPDVVAIHGGGGRDAVHSWADVHIALEVKGIWNEALEQVTVYGRMMLDKAKRSHGVVIVYNHITQTVRFCFFTRIGFFTTPTMPLTTPEGFKGIARGLLGMMCLPRDEAGIDEHHLVRDEQSYIYLPTEDASGHWWKVDDVLSHRRSVIGPATHVYALNALPGVAQGDTPSSEHLSQGLAQSTPKNAVTLSKTVSLPASPGKVDPPSKQPSTPQSAEPSNKVEPPQVSTKAPETTEYDRIILKELPTVRPDVDWPNLPVDSMDGPLIVKESWPYQDRARLEPEMFRETQGKHGIPDVLSVVSYPHIMDIFANLTDIRACNDYTDAPPTKGKELKPERRALVRMICSTRGKSLLHIVDDPKSLVKALIDSMIGHMHLFLKGYLHRDVTIGNVLAQYERQERTKEMQEKNDPILATERFTFLERHLTDCLGFIIDGDLAITWMEPRIPAKNRSGTVSFISSRVLSGWLLDRNPLPTAIDDLESFVWILLWAALHAAEVKTLQEERWLEALPSDDDVRLVAYVKIAIMTDDFEPEDFSAPFQTLIPLLKEWFTIANGGKAAVDSFAKKWFSRDSTNDLAVQKPDEYIMELKMLCLDYYQRYLEKAVKFLDTLE